MTVEQIAIRQEVRQMLNEAGINRNTLKEIVKDVIREDVIKYVVRSKNETNLEGLIDKQIDRVLKSSVDKYIKDAVEDRIRDLFRYACFKIDVDICDSHGNFLDDSNDKEG